jgi:SAM-dependent methyltransferase
VEVAAQRMRDAGVPEAAFMQADIGRLPLPSQSLDVVFSEGVLHHTDSTENALKSLAMLLRPGGRFLFYVYRRKGPIREFTDDHIRDRLRELPPEQAWKAMMPLTHLGKALGELDVNIEIPEAIPLLDIPAGKINLQRFFYGYVSKRSTGPSSRSKR